MKAEINKWIPTLGMLVADLCLVAYDALQLVA